MQFSHSSRTERCIATINTSPYGRHGGDAALLPPNLPSFCMFREVGYAQRTVFWL